MKRLNPSAVSAPIGLYSHASQVHGSSRTVFVAGQVGIRPDGTLAGDDFRSQMVQTLENMRSILADAQMTLDDVTKFTTYLVHDADVEVFYNTRAELFPHLFRHPQYPPNTLLIVRRLVRPELLIEIEGTAATDGQPTGTPH